VKNLFEPCQWVRGLASKASWGSLRMAGRPGRLHAAAAGINSLPGLAEGTAAAPWWLGERLPKELSCAVAVGWILELIFRCVLRCG